MIFIIKGFQTIFEVAIKMKNNSPKTFNDENTILIFKLCTYAKLNCLKQNCFDM